MRSYTHALTHTHTQALYNTTKATAGTMLGVEEGLALTWIDHFTRCILEEDPDLIVSVHPLVSYRERERERERESE